jgi:triacylglycerol lipase
MNYLLCIFLVILFPSCGTLGAHSVDNNKTAQVIIPLKYPVVLVHGVLAHDRGGITNFWGKIPDILKENGVKVFFGNTDAHGDFESNAIILKATIDRILEETDSEKVNIIAHSKGGVDSRYFIWRYDYGNKVASLTTIATPHHGAELADLIYQEDIVHSKDVKKALKVFGTLYGDINPDIYNVIYQLTTENMDKFNETIGMDQNVYYQSIYSIMSNSFDNIKYFHSYQLIKKIHGDNDGVVSEWSAKWGNNIKKIDGRVSHMEIVDRNTFGVSNPDLRLNYINRTNIPNIYLNIVNELSEMGF